MGECLILKAGAGTDTSNATAKSEHILSGYTAYVNDILVTGTMIDHGSISNELSAGDIVELKEGYYKLSTLTIKTLASQTRATAISSDILDSKTAWVNGALLTGSMVNRGAVAYGLPINGAYTIPAGFHNGAGKVTQSIASQGGWTVTPSTRNILACDAGRYTTGAIWVAGDGNLVSGNIKKGVSIFGVGGSLNGYQSGPTDIYNRGYNPYKLHGYGSVFQEGQILLSFVNSGVTLLSSEFIDFRGKTSFNMDYVPSTYVGGKFQVVSENPQYVYLTNSETLSIYTTTKSLNFIIPTGFIGAISLYFYNSNGNLYINRIWLS